LANGTSINYEVIINRGCATLEIILTDHSLSEIEEMVE